MPSCSGDFESRPNGALSRCLPLISWRRKYVFKTPRSVAVGSCRRQPSIAVSGVKYQIHQPSALPVLAAAGEFLGDEKARACLWRLRGM